MAEKPIKTPLPADLPEDWNVGQTVAPDGTTVGLTEQHGYNYLMAAVNRAQRGVNEVNEAFETVSGKRTCRFVVGTSTAGWTEADCDYLCDGTDDQVEIQAAIKALPTGGGEIVLLDGTYQLSANISVPKVSGNAALTGNPGSTVISGGGLSVGNFTSSFFKFFIKGLVFENSAVSGSEISLFIKDCCFINTRVNYYHQNVDANYIFVCTGNEFQKVGTNGAISAFATGDKTENITTCIILNNSIYAEADSTIISVTESGASTMQHVISGNAVICDRECSIQVNTSGDITGNSLYNCNIYDYGGCAIVGNRLFGGNIVTDTAKLDALIADKGATVLGNYIKDGQISADGNITITGNSVVIISDDTVESAIRLRKTASNAAEDQFPAVVGNYVAGGPCGILLADPGSSTENKDCKNAMINSNRIYGSQIPIKIGKYWSGCMVTDNLFTTGAIEDNGTSNIIRFNSDDLSTGGSTPATVQQATPTVSVSADGTVTARATQAAGYVVAGTRSATHKLSASDDPDLTPENIKEGVTVFGVTGTLSAGGGTAGVESFNGRSGAVIPGNNDYTAEMVGAIAASSVKDIQAVTQTEYDSLTTKNPSTLYLIKE